MMGDEARDRLIAAIKQLPQPRDRGQAVDYSCWFDANDLACGRASSGDIILSLTIEKGAALTFLLGPQQAQALLAGLQNELGVPDLSAPAGSRPN